MSNISGESSIHGGATRRPRVRIPGLPGPKCWCGEEIKELISKSNPNPYRRYFRCVYAAERRLVNDNHAFKWHDEALVDEVTQLDYQVRVLEDEVLNLKLEIREMDARGGPKNQIGSWIPIVACASIVVVVLGVIVFGTWFRK